MGVKTQLLSDLKPATGGPMMKMVSVNRPITHELSEVTLSVTMYFPGSLYRCLGDLAAISEGTVVPSPKSHWKLVKFVLRKPSADLF